MSVIILSRDDEGRPRSIGDLVEEVLEVAPDTVARIVKGPISGIEVPETAAVAWLMRTYTASGKKRKGV